MSANPARILTEAGEQNADGIAVKLDDFEGSYGMVSEATAARLVAQREGGGCR